MPLREMDAVVENGYIIVVSPDGVAEHPREVATGVNVGNPMLLLRSGNMHNALTRTKKFTRTVHPRLAPLFCEREHRRGPTDSAPRAYPAAE